jgi:Xaa-Pro aminopeptidase
MICAFIAAAVALILPLCVRYITKTIVEEDVTNVLQQIYMIGAVMFVLIIIQAVCHFFVDYRGHAMGAMMESDLRSELFAHYQKLSFGFYDQQKTGQLMSRISNDLLSLAELYHHGPEDLMIYSVRFIGAFAILMHINAQLTVAVFVFLPIMAVYTVYFNKKLNMKYRKTKENISYVNAQVEDNLSGIRVVKSFANEETEKVKFARENNRFLESRKSLYKHEAYFFGGIQGFIQLITVAVVVFGGISKTNANLDLADLITFLLYVGYLTEPIQRLTHIIQQYQEGITGFERFMDIVEVEPDIQDAADAIELNDVQGNVQFRDVGFKYRQNGGHVLHNISLDVKAGEYIQGKNFGRIAINSSEDNEMADGLSYTQRLALEEALGSASDRFVSSNDLLYEWLSVKTPEEVEIMRKAAQLTADWQIEAYKQVVPGKSTDADIAKFLKGKIAEYGFKDGWAPDQNPNVNSGPDRGHSHATDKVIMPGDVIQIDFGIRVHDMWVTDIQRFAYVLREGETTAPDSVQQYWENSKQGSRIALAAMRPGATGYEVDKAQREFMEQQGSEYVMWSTGHPVGYVAHDVGPSLGGGQLPEPRPSSLKPLKEGMVFAFDGFFTWKLPDGGEKTMSVEEMAVITADGAEYLIEPQEELILIR